MLKIISIITMKIINIKYYNFLYYIIISYNFLLKIKDYNNNNIIYKIFN